MRLTRSARKRINDSRKQERQKRQLLNELRKQPCYDCHNEFPIEAMEFDHVPGRGGKISCVGARPSIRAVLDEARKCDVVCANCHKMRTAARRRGARKHRRDLDAHLDGIVEALERERAALKEVVAQNADRFRKEETA